MFRRKLGSFVQDPIWVKITSLCVILFFAFLADATLSYWVPNFLEDILDNTATVGWVIGFSSLVGFLADLALPQIIKGITVRKLVLLSISGSFIFSLLLLWVTWMPFMILVLMSMAVWGIYFELLTFAQQQFVSDYTPVRIHPAAWGVIGVFKSAGYFLGPMIAWVFLEKNLRYPLYLSFLFLFISYLSLSLYKTKHERSLDINVDEVNLLREFEHWRVLFSRVWPVVILSLLLGTIDALFWTIGPILNEELSKESFLGGMFLPSYILPSLFVGLVIAKWRIYKGKKKMAEKYLLLSGFLFTLLIFFDNALILVVLVFIASIALSLCFPLVDGVYSDIVVRMGRERKHMMGLSASAMSLAYIVGPPLSGVIASAVGNKMSFVIMGIVSFLICLILLFVTPKKLLLPQEAIREWQD